MPYSTISYKMKGHVVFINISCAGKNPGKCIESLVEIINNFGKNDSVVIIWNLGRGINAECNDFCRMMMRLLIRTVGRSVRVILENAPPAMKEEYQKAVRNKALRERVEIFPLAA